MEAWLREQRRSPAGSAPPSFSSNLRRRTGSATSNQNTLGPERAGGSASGRGRHSSHSSNSNEGRDDLEDQSPFPPIIVEQKEPDEQEEQVESIGSTCHSASCFSSIFCAFIGATLSWYCWGLAFLAPLGPSRNIIQPQVARYSHRLGPRSFYALQVGRLLGVPLYGHMGDRHGRRAAFAASMVLTGVATAAMGCFYPLRLNGAGHGSGVRAAWSVLRFLVGAGVAGQCPANILVPMESCRAEKAGAFAAAIGHAGMPIGLALAATAAYACLYWEGSATRFPEGLRLAQLVGVLLVPAALWAFVAAEEGEVFKDMEEAGEKERQPLLVLLRTRGCGLVGGSFAVTSDAFLQCAIVFYWPILLPHGLGYGGLHVYACLAIALLTMAGFSLLGTALRERLVRRITLFRIGAVIAAVGMWGWFRLVRSHKPTLLLVADIVVLGVGLGLLHGAMDALLVEPFPTPIAYTGLALLYQVTNALVHILYPSLAYWLLSLGESSSLHALGIAPDVNGIGMVVASLLLGGVALVSVKYLKAYQRPSSLPRRGLRIRECIQLSSNPSSEPSTIVINPDSSIASSQPERPLASSPASRSFRFQQREIAHPP